MTCILTHTGQRMDYLNPTVSMIMIEDIARGLSRESRFNGQSKVPYFVAQHCVIVSELVPEQFAFEALMHDATEAYMKDIPTPLKQLLPRYMELEDQLDQVIRLAFEIPFIQSPEVKNADRRALTIEMASFTDYEIPGVSEVKRFIRAWSPQECYDVFLERFHQLRGR